MLRSIISAVVALAITATNVSSTSGQGTSPPITAAWPTDPALIGVPTSIDYCVSRAEPLANPGGTLLRTARDMGIGTPQLGGISGPVATFFLDRSPLFAAESILSVAGMYDAPPMDVYEGTLQYARGFVGRYYGKGDWPTPTMQENGRAVQKLIMSFEQTRYYGDEDLGNCGLVILRATFRSDPYSAAEFYADLMSKDMAPHFLAPLRNNGRLAIANYQASSEGWMFPEGGLGAWLNTPIPPARPGGL